MVVFRQSKGLRRLKRPRTGPDGRPETGQHRSGGRKSSQKQRTAKFLSPPEPRPEHKSGEIGRKCVVKPEKRTLGGVPAGLRGRLLRRNSLLRYLKAM